MMIQKYRPYKDYYLNISMEAEEHLSFDEIAVCAITTNIDARMQPECEKVIEKFQGISEEAQELSFEELIDEIAWMGIYNQKVLELLDEHEIESYEDEYGALGWVDPKGNFYFSGSTGDYPMYESEEELKKVLSDIQELQELEKIKHTPEGKQKIARRKLKEKLQQKNEDE